MTERSTSLEHEREHEHEYISDSSNLQQLGADLLEWFAVHRRDLPWRVDRNPYRVWVSEIMLQQTRVDTVIPYYNRFLEAFPTVAALAAASEAEVLKLWEGLGYYSRARNLHRGAQEVVSQFEGELPRTVTALRTLPGIGRYTAGAIASIAFNEPVPAVDGNVLRVIARVAGITDLITKAATQRRVEAYVEQMIPPGRAALMTEALMELGALVCLPRTPACSRCPWQTKCVANAQGIADDLPNRPSRTPPRIVTGAVAVVANDESVLVTQRPAEGLLAGLWEFPWIETPNVDDVSATGADAEVDQLRNALRDHFGVHVRIVRQLMPVRHVFSHLEWRLNVYECQLVNGASDPKHPSTTPTKWVTKARLEQLPFGRAHRRIATAWLKGSKEEGQRQLFAPY